MPEMTDPHNSLVSFQEVYSQGRLVPQRCALHPDLSVFADRANGSPRFTYAQIESGIVKATVIYIFKQDIDGIPRFELGYAVAEGFRQRGIAMDVVKKSLAEIQKGLCQSGRSFYVRAVVGETNIASQKIAARLISSSPDQITDNVSGLPALAYLLLIKC
ncbi:GNAT family N-acetyltransferase [Caballeronia sp. GaOx3]|uniref:GNAT family N-acetyltransferase n=1 Tax=Caballeronia sp. GaOx3 TaxID=2921740 RepID=UPI0020287D05|nr:GNAT family N-acetyltransferase [Caballeronia sp. GaOx3]